MKIRTDEYLIALQKKEYSRVISPWGIEQDSNRFKEWRNVEKKHQYLRGFYEKLKGTSNGLNNNHGFYFNLVCPPIILELNNIIKELAGDKYSNLKPSDILWGTLPSYEVNAKSIINGDKSIITINESLLYLLYETYRLIWYVLYESSNDSKEGTLQIKVDKSKFSKINQKYFIYFKELYSNFLLTGITHSNRTNIPDLNVINKTAAHTFDVSVFFIFCHEYAHISLDHFSNRDTKTKSIYKEQETEADELSSFFSFIFNGKRNYHYSFGMLSLELFFAFSKFISKIIEKNEEKHPELELRREAINMGYYVTIGQIGAEDDLKSIKEFGDNIYELLIFLWSKVEKDILHEFETALNKKTNFKEKDGLFTTMIKKLKNLFFFNQKPKSAINELFEKFAPFFDYMMDKEGVHLPILNSYTKNRFKENEIHSIISSICFRIQMFGDREKSITFERVYKSISRSKKIKISKKELNNIFEYVDKEYINFLHQKMNNKE
ncbi:MAG: hypothetical protein DHS20C18_13070 [Saprospiraceae bacterium]|nr:MAG: hypothetical protein DHS20C18_13070 [Saprospiraceae bacterium]